MDLAFLTQIGGDGIWSWILWIVFMVVFFLFYPRIMISQMMWKLEKTAAELEEMSRKSKEFIAKEMNPKPTKELKDSVDMFFEFFVIGPVSMDPFGIMSKMEHLIRGQKERFTIFVKEHAPKANKEKQACLEMGLAGGISVHQVAKIVRHYVELVRKTKSLQIAMLLQMQLPLIERIAKSLYKGTQSLAKGEPIGDSIGPMAAAHLIGNHKVREIEENIMMATVPMDGRTLYVVKAKGPGGRLGRPGKAVEKLVNRNKITRVITIDAAAKLEGEKTGSIAEGVGVAMGGPGVEKSYIENVTVKKGIPLDSIIVKMSQEQAITPMRKAIKDALPGVRESLSRSLKRTKKGSKLVVVGVGNTSGIGNTGKELRKVFAWVDAYERKVKAAQKKKRKRRLF